VPYQLSQINHGELAIGVEDQLLDVVLFNMGFIGMVPYYHIYEKVF
jgi:hypothetical protein